MPENESTPKPHKLKNFAQINGACRMAKLTDGLKKKACPNCGTVHGLRECPFCHYRRGKK